MLRLNIIIVSICVSVAFGQEWHEGKGIVTMGEYSTLAEARKLALSYARTNAIEQVGLKITGASAMVQKEDARDYFNNFIKFTQTKTNGRIVEEEILSDGIVNQKTADGLSVTFYQILINALVKLETGEPDPEFRLSLSLNEDSYQNDEDMVIELSATKECYVTIFNLYSNDSLLVIFPNEILNDNHLKAGAILQIPPEEANWKMPVGLANDSLDFDQEVIYVVATKENVPFGVSESVEREGLIAQSGALLAVNRWLIEIETSGRTEVNKFYDIWK